MAILAGAFNGVVYDLSTSVLSANSSKLLATLFSLMKGVGGYSGWRWIFIMEGIITVVVSAMSVFIMIAFPRTDYPFLS